MYERFTDRARRVYQLANQEAQRFNHEYVGVEHILLGLLKEGSGVAANVLKNLGMELGIIRMEVEKIVQAGLDVVTMGKMPMTPCAKKVAGYAIEEAKNLNHNYVGTEHVLLGLLREQEGVAAQVLMNLGLKLEDVREEVLHLLGCSAEEKSEEQKMEKVIAKHMYTWHAQIEMPAILGILADSLAKAFMKETGLTADKVNLYVRYKGDTTYFGFCKDDGIPPQRQPESSTTDIPTSNCNCQSLLHGHEANCPLR